MTIHNEARYEAGRDAAIKRNARKGRQHRWFKENADAQELSDWLNGVGDFGPIWTTADPADQEAYDKAVAEAWAHGQEHNYCAHQDVDLLSEQYDVRYTQNPLTNGMYAGSFGEMLGSMHDALTEWGGLSEKQTALVRSALARKRQWVAETAAKAEQRAEELQGKVWVGEIKQRMVFDLTVNKVLSFEGQYGFTYIHLCEDADGNQIVYKGSKRFPEGALKVKATVKAHDEREGVKQTLITRPAEV